MPQFDRIYKITLGVQGSDGVVIEGKARSNGLQVTFDIVKDLTQKTNKCKLSIKNLNDITAKLLEKEDTICILEVGYSQDIGLRRIFIGWVTQCTTTVDANSGEVTTSLELADGQIAIRDTVVSVSYAEAVSRQKVIEDIAKEMGLNLKIADDCVFLPVANGFSFIGKGATCLDKICDGTGCSWSIQNNIIQVIKDGNSNGERYGYVFSAGTGLIGFPQRIITAPKKTDSNTATESKKAKTNKDETKEKRAGWKITTLLQPTLNPADIIRVESKIITGWFKVETLRHVGDYNGQNWYTEMEIIELKEEEKQSENAQ